MFDTSSSTSLPAHSPAASQTAKEDFGRLIRRIQQSNSGQFAPIKVVETDAGKVFVVHNRDWSQYRQLAMQAQEAGNLIQAEFMWLASLGEAKAFHPHDPRLMVSVESLANLYASMGRFDQAEAYGKQAVEIAMQAFGHDHPSLARCLNNLAGLFYQQGRYAEAEPVCRRLLAIYEKNYPQEHLDVVMATTNLAMLYHAQGKYKLAERLYIRLISLAGSEISQDQNQMENLLSNYASLLDSTGRADLASEVRARGRSLFPTV